MPLTAEAKAEILELFDAENRKAKKNGKRVNWKERRKLIAEVFPSVDRIDWEKALTADFDMFGRIIRDVEKLAQAEPGRSGPRPGVDPEQTLAMFKRMNRDDYTMLQFAEAFRLLATHRHNGEPWSYRQIANKTGLSLKKVYSLINEEQYPTVTEMAVVAVAFDKDPSFFLEYRVEFVATATQFKLTANPEASVAAYRRLVEAA